MVKKYHEIRSITDVQEAFRQRFHDRNPPAKRTIENNVKKYEKEGTSLNLNKQRSGRRRTTRN